MKDIILTDPLAVLEPIVFVWGIATPFVISGLISDVMNNHELDKRHIIEAIVLIATGLILVAVAAAVNGGKTA